MGLSPETFKEMESKDGEFGQQITPEELRLATENYEECRRITQETRKQEQVDRESNDDFAYVEAHDTCTQELINTLKSNSGD